MKKRISQFEIKKIKIIEKDIKIKMEKYEIDEKLAESFLYEIAEKRCFAKIVKFFFKINISLFLEIRN